MERIGDGFLLGAALVTLVILLPMFFRANGTRPFITGYALYTLGLVAAASYGVIHDDSSPIYAIIRAYFIGVLILTTVWAIRRGH
jgi:hypothetical protein